MLELPNFGHMTTSIIQFDLGDKTFFVTYNGQKSSKLKSCLSKQPLRTQKKLKESEVMH